MTPELKQNITFYRVQQVNIVRSGENPNYGWVVLCTFTINYTLPIIAIQTLGLLLPEISDEFSLSPVQQGWLASSVLFGNLIFEIPLNWWTSRYRPWRVASISFASAALFVAFNAWAPTFAVLLIARVCLGFATLTAQAPRTLVILQWIPSKHTALANGVLYSIIEGFIGLGSIVIPLILVWVGDWRDTLYIWAGVCLVVSIIWFFVGRDRVTPEHRDQMFSQAGTPMASILKYKEPWILGIGVAGVFGGYMAFTTFWPTFTHDEYGTAITWAGLIIGLMGIASVPAMLGLTALSSFGRHTPMLLAISGLGVSLTYIGLLYTGSLPLLLLLGIINGMTFYFLPLVATTLYRLPGIKLGKSPLHWPWYSHWTGVDRRWGL